MISTKTIPKKRKTTKKPSKNKFLVVAIGASSGGLEAGKELFKNLPVDTGMAFIFIQHLSPNHKSILTELLAKSTKMKVQEIEDMDKMEPNNVYVIPHDKGIQITDGHIQLIPRSKSSSAVSIDILFTSLAQTHKAGAIGVVLSGNASDGTIGLRAIKESGGITFAQDKSAEFDSMPESAIREGVIDFVLSPKKIALELERLSRYAENKGIIQSLNESEIIDSNPDLKLIIQILYNKIGIDFMPYKMGTIKRRILRRMFLHRLKTLPEYIAMLTAKDNEVRLLYNDLLINVTYFFRDADAFQHLKSTVLPRLIKNKTKDEPLRIWVPACSTGQEAYSIAIIILEILGSKLQGKQVQVFATDLSELAIKKARKGNYSQHEIRGMSAQRLSRFFTKVDDSYQVTKEVRDLCSFATHNMLTDPPFSKIDLITCCNVLIYFDTPMHQKVFNTFHYALNPGGQLMLGSSESIGSSRLFVQINKTINIYTRAKGIYSLPDLMMRVSRTSPIIKKVQEDRKNTHNDAEGAEEAIMSILMSRYIPAYVVINYNKDIIQFKGPTFNYLQHATGKATLNILTMARPEILFHLRDAISVAINTKQEIRKGGIEVNNGAKHSIVELDVIPLLTHDSEPLLLVIFTERQYEALQNDRLIEEHISAKGIKSIDKLKVELALVNRELVAVTKEYEKANTVLQEANEEILSRNEEFQSMNEEMETSKEEIESANQELITINQELHIRNQQLAEANDFGEAIIATLHEPILILDKDLCIKSSNEAFYKKFMLLRKSTEGKKLFELGNHQWDIPSLRELLENIVQKNTYFNDYEITHVFPDIGKRTMLLNGMRIVQQINNEQLILLAFTDTTEQTLERKVEKNALEEIISERTETLKQTFASLEERNIVLEKLNKELETFTFISSHDLQEPLRKIKNFAACLLKEEQQQLSQSGKEYLSRMNETVSRMQTLIEDLLLYARIKDNKKDLQETDLSVMIDEALIDFKEIIIQKKALIKRSGFSKVNVTRFHIRQLLHNLISNALRFSQTEKAPIIHIKCETKLGKKLHKELIPNSMYCHLSISDNGIGFNSVYKERIFEVFQRLHEYEEYKGTGIGLAICKRIVEQHGGIIIATGELNKGATFDVYLPVS